MSSGLSGHSHSLIPSHQSESDTVTDVGVNTMDDCIDPPTACKEQLTLVHTHNTQFLLDSTVCRDRNTIMTSYVNEKYNNHQLQN